MGTRKYARKGFTAKKAIRAALEPFERPSRRAHQTAIAGLDLAAAQQLLAALPAEQHEDRHTDAAPTFAEMIAFGAAGIADITFTGFRVDDDQLDERVTLTGFAIPQASLDADAMRQVLGRAADAKVAWTRDKDQALLTVAW